MSTIVLSCPGCGKRYELSASLAGKKARCKACSHEFTIPVPRQTAPAAAVAPSRPKSTTSARSVTPPPELDSFDPYDDVEDHAATSSSVSHEDDDVKLPRRAGVVRTSEKSATKKKKRRANSAFTAASDWAGRIPLIGLGLTVVLTLMALVIPPFAFLSLVILVLCGLIMMVSGGIWAIVNAFRESVFCGVLYMFIPLYGLYYLVTRWDHMARPFTTYLVGLLILLVVPKGYMAAGMLPGLEPGAGQRGLNNIPGAAADFNAPPHVGFQANRPASADPNQVNVIAPPAVGGQPVDRFPGMPNNMPSVPNGMPPNFPPPPNFGPKAPAGMDNIPGAPGGMPGPNPGSIGPGQRFGQPGGVPVQ